MWRVNGVVYQCSRFTDRTVKICYVMHTKNWNSSCPESSFEVGPITLPSSLILTLTPSTWPWPMTLTFSPQRAMVMAYIQATDQGQTYDLIWSLAVLDPRVGHTMDVLSPFMPVLCHSDWLFHGESCPRLDVVHPGRAWSSSPAYTWHCFLHYLFLQATPLFPHGVTIVC